MLNTLIADRREFGRTRVEAALYYRHRPQQDLRKAVVIETSVRGARVIMEGEVKVGERREIALVADGSAYFSCRARVAWVQHLPGGKTLAGLDFCAPGTDGLTYL